jgi:hypothetical protein
MHQFLLDTLDDNDTQFLDDMNRLLYFKFPDEINSREDLENNGPYVYDDLYDRINDKIYEYCKNHRKLISHNFNPNLKR